MAKISSNAAIDEQEYSNGPNKKTHSFAIVEPHEELGAGRQGFLAKILSEFQHHLNERESHFLGYPLNVRCNFLMDLSPLLQFHINNIGDPFKDSNLGMHSKQFEVAVLDWFGQLWEIEKEEYWGYVTNGGSEGNFQGLLLGRELLPDGILYTSRESHYSIFKAARMFRMDCKIIGTLITGEIDYTDLRETLRLNKDKPAIINVNIGTTFKGGVDKLDVIIKTLEECGFSENRFYIHCDTALCGLISPFLQQGPLFSFKKPIGSVSVSMHKLFGAPMPCGVHMTRKRYISTVSKNIEYIETLDNTISGSRNGHAPIFMWYGLNLKGRSGIQKDVNKCLMNARYLRDRLKNAGISNMHNEMSLVVVFERPLGCEFVKHWQLSCQGNMAHVVVMPHVTTEMLDNFVKDFVRERDVWYQFGQIEPPCLGEDTGTCNCTCSRHGKGSSTV
ncbi:serine decarboxylase [Phtheirospermum japonicum]|uniref:Serine decarboxylase n=1 Tax=Phtheirospermum japonicum TaxID=374723 RepID=A0A830B1G8_9LAMI|nr:serine decarboxylase [Phtheirospermum japonicum]